MKKPTCIALLALAAFAAPAQYSIDWFKVSGGGGTSTGSVYAVSGTIGQPDATANNAMTGGSYSLTGGFWSLYAVQVPGYPTLTIRLVGLNSAVVSWLNTGGYTLQTNGNLTTANWTGYGGNIMLSNGTNNVTISPATGNLYFRLK